MKSVLLIGMGKFGQILGENLLRMGDEVMIVDKNENIVNMLAPKYTNALIANCMHEANLRSMDIPSFDVCVVAIGDDFQSSLEITSLLRELGAKYVVSKAATEIQRKFLLRNGADEVIYPDRDLAEKLAVRMNASKVFDYIELDSEYSIFENSHPCFKTSKRISVSALSSQVATPLLLTSSTHALFKYTNIRILSLARTMRICIPFPLNAVRTSSTRPLFAVSQPLNISFCASRPNTHTCR